MKGAKTSQFQGGAMHWKEEYIHLHPPASINSKILIDTQFQRNLKANVRWLPSHFLCQGSCGAGSRSWQTRLTLTRRGLLTVDSAAHCPTSGCFASLCFKSRRQEDLDDMDVLDLSVTKQPTSLPYSKRFDIDGCWWHLWMPQTGNNTFGRHTFFASRDPCGHTSWSRAPSLFAINTFLYFTFLKTQFFLEQYEPTNRLNH